ncbi:hypothetical protein DB346_01810 [Verrucomicrobia bacterium LW23]|nr:hypothetical protein DB346_01810 [Verrucomicrobia bacterium LW23]
MLRTLGNFLTILACVQLMGGHWAALQMVAWAGMLVDHSRRGETIVAALGKTFDGEHPCSLCHTVKIGKAKEQDAQKDAALKSTVKLEFLLAARHLIAMPRLVERPSSFAPHRASVSTRADVPPRPPPRSGVV